jgi:ligand-binding sensor domain-containing protein
LVAQHLCFSHLTAEHGLSHNVANNVVQDRWGFVWISTFGGLSRFDGYEVKVFGHDPDAPHSLSSSHIRAMSIDPTGLIWLGTNNGLNRFDPRTETFARYRHQPDKPDSPGFDFVTSLYIDRAGQIWVGGLGAVDRLDPETGVFGHYRHLPDDPTTIGLGTVHSICQDREGNLWFGNRGGGGLSRLDQGRQGFVRYRHDPNNPHSLSDDSVYVVYVDRAGELWVGTEDAGLNRLTDLSGTGRQDTCAGDHTTASFRHYLCDTLDLQSLSNDYVRDILEDQSGHLWVATAGGLNRMDRATGTFVHCLHSPADSASISTDDTSRLFEDRAGGLWLTTNNQGVDYCSPKHQRFRQYRHDPNNSNSLDDEDIRTVYEDASGVLWVGTKKGLNRLERARNRITRYQHAPGDPASLSSCLHVEAIAEDRDGKLWIGTWGRELNRFDPLRERFWRPGDDPANPCFRDTIAICEDHRGDMWVGDYNQGLYCFTGPAAGTSDRTTKTFVRYGHDPEDPASLSNNWVKSIFHDRAGNLWVGTYNGLNRLDRDTGTFRRYGERNGIPNATVTGILEDGSHLWLSANQGLVKFDPQAGTFQGYGPSEGLRTRSEVNGCFQSPDGEMFFAGHGGLIAFRPEQIIDNQDIPAVVITNLMLFNKAAPIGGDSPLQQAVCATDGIALSDQDYSFAFEFAALSFVDPRKNRYKYKLEGFDQAWHEIDSRRRYAAYSNLPAGEYVFRVLGSNNHNVWNTEDASIRVKVARPVWETLRLEKEAAEAANRAKSMFFGERQSRAAYTAKRHPGL